MSTKTEQQTGEGAALRNETIRDYENRVKHYYRVWFSNGRERTAKLVCDTHRFPIGKTSVETYSRLFPWAECPKMNRLIIDNRYPTFEQAFNAL